MAKLKQSRDRNAIRTKLSLDEKYKQWNHRTVQKTDDPFREKSGKIAIRKSDS